LALPVRGGSLKDHIKIVGFPLSLNNILNIKAQWPDFDDKRRINRVRINETARIKVANLSDHKSNPLGMESS
jgi:hypothetical protein